MNKKGYAISTGRKDPLALKSRCADLHRSQRQPKSVTAVEWAVLVPVRRPRMNTSSYKKDQ
jgi:hypothetical protein